MTNLVDKPFHFCSRQILTYLTSRRAKNIRELLEGIQDSDTMSVYQHTHRYLEQHQSISPEPVNDYAYWVTHMLQDKLLGEKIASIDLKQFNSLVEIRSQIIDTIDNSLKINSRLLIFDAPPGDEFHFMSAQVFVYPTKYFASNLTEFLNCLINIPTNSILYHFTEARFNQTPNDIFHWLSEAINETRLAEILRKIDPYTLTEENLRETLINHTMVRLKEVENG